MHLRPEIYEKWEEALKHRGNAEKLSREGKLQEAEIEANIALLLGIQTIIELSKEPEMHDLSVIANNILSDMFERNEVGKHYTPKERLERADSALKQLFAEIPPDILRPLR
ncbi:MAG: hypothetical protein NTX52_02275 [Planctomycetota bacterium]|nr:hypothetical protein [Planctomycetota bacterium]